MLWSPKDRELIDALETIQSNFLKKIFCPTLPPTSDYWDRLQHYKLYSLQRRRERYAIMYVWKVLHNLYPNPGIHMNDSTKDHIAHPNDGINLDAHIRLGMTAHHNVSEAIPDWLKDKSVLKTCCELFNAIPPTLRQPVAADKEPDFAKFKEDLDKWLTKVPDRPACTGRFNPAGSNSILQQIRYIPRD